MTKGELVFQALHARFAPAIRHFARRHIRIPDAVREFEHDVALVLIEALHRDAVTDPDRLDAFVLGICRNVLRDRTALQHHRGALLQKFATELEVLEADGPTHGDDETMRLESCVSGLGLASRMLLHLSYYEAVPHHQIAADLEVSESNARTLRHRLVAAVRDTMTKSLEWDAT